MLRPPILCRSYEATIRRAEQGLSALCLPVVLADQNQRCYPPAPSRNCLSQARTQRNKELAGCKNLGLDSINFVYFVDSGAIFKLCRGGISPAEWKPTASNHGTNPKSYYTSRQSYAGRRQRKQQQRTGEDNRGRG